MKRPVYISSSCIKGERIGDVVEVLAQAGITRIELSGGMAYYGSIADDLLRLKDEYGLDYLVHGYFPPPEEDFIIDLINDRERAFAFLREAIGISQRLGAGLYSTHAGFTVDVLPLTRGGTLSGEPPADKRKAEEILYNNLRNLMAEVVGPDFRFAVENMYPLMGREDYALLAVPEDMLRFLEFSRDYPNLGMVLDMGHLNLSASVVGFDRMEFAREVMKGYGDRVFEMHISENDGSFDAHCIAREGSWQLEVAGWEEAKGVPAVFEWRGAPVQDVIDNYRELVNSKLFA